MRLPVNFVRVRRSTVRVAATIAAVGTALGVQARASALPPVAADSESSTLFASGAKALHEGRAGDAVDLFEALADRGVVDAAASYDRGMAYAMRVRIGAEQGGDLGRAAQGFEEARELSRDSHLIDDASRALTTVRSEVARRRLRAGQPADVESGRTIARALAGVVPEDGWAIVCVVASMAFSVGLFLRWVGRTTRLRVAGGVSAGVAAPALTLAVAMTLASRHDRLELREAVVVSPSARPTDERGIALPGATSLPEGALVEVIDERGDSTRVRFGASDEWIASSAVRALAK
ncbi:MAG TPA: hypothetical protein VEK07_11025 [Polyangiaceae bacterium]|nr:hypothetical protein [Polyangiaceae bacterium]